MKFKSCQKGQTSVEYILLVGVMIVLSITFFREVREYLVDNPDSLINGYLGNYRSSFDNGTGYKRFRLNR